MIVAYFLTISSFTGHIVVVSKRQKLFTTSVFSLSILSLVVEPVVVINLDFFTFNPSLFFGDGPCFSLLRLAGHLLFQLSE